MGINLLRLALQFFLTLSGALRLNFFRCNKKERLLFPSGSCSVTARCCCYAPLSHSRASIKGRLNKAAHVVSSNSPRVIDLPQQSLGSTSSNTSARFVRFGSLALSLPNVHRASPSPLSTLYCCLGNSRDVCPSIAHTRRAQPLCSRTLLKPLGGMSCQNFIFTVHARLLTLHVRYICRTTQQLDCDLATFLHHPKTPSDLKSRKVESLTGAPTSRQPVMLLSTSTVQSKQL